MDEVTQFYISQGALGISVFVLGWAVKYLWGLREEERKAHTAELAKLNEERLAEGRALIPVIKDLGNAVKELKDQQAAFISYTAKDRK